MLEFAVIFEGSAFSLEGRDHGFHTAKPAIALEKVFADGHGGRQRHAQGFNSLTCGEMIFFRTDEEFLDRADSNTVLAFTPEPVACPLFQGPFTCLDPFPQATHSRPELRHRRESSQVVMRSAVDPP